MKEEYSTRVTPAPPAPPRPEARPTTRADLALFFAIAFGGSWGLAGAAYAAGVRLGPVSSIAIGVPYMFFPALAAVVVELRRGARLEDSLDLRFSVNAWWAVGWLGPVVLAFVALGVGLLLPGVSLITDATAMLERFASRLSPEQLAEAKTRLQGLSLWPMVGAQVMQALVAGATINAIAAFGEELGWRGFLQRELSGLGFWKSSCLIGLLWGPWHWALIIQGYNYPEHPVPGLFLMTAMTVLLSPLFAAVRLRGKSVLAAALAHGSFNAIAGLPIELSRGGSDLVVGLTGAAGLGALLAANVALFLALRAPAPPKP